MMYTRVNSAYVSMSGSPLGDKGYIPLLLLPGDESRRPSFRDVAPGSSFEGREERGGGERDLRRLSSEG